MAHSGYYEHWLTVAATVAVENGVVDPTELEQRAGGAFPLSRPSVEPQVDGTGEQRFAVGDRVRVAALEELLTERGLVPPGFVDEVNRAHEQDIGPRNGAKVVARAWVDPEYRRRLLADGTAAIAEPRRRCGHVNASGVYGAPHLGGVVKVPRSWACGPDDRATRRRTDPEVVVPLRITPAAARPPRRPPRSATARAGPRATASPGATARGAAGTAAPGST